MATESSNMTFGCESLLDVDVVLTDFSVPLSDGWSTNVVCDLHLSCMDFDSWMNSDTPFLDSIVVL